MNEEETGHASPPIKACDMLLTTYTIQSDSRFIFGVRIGALFIRVLLVALSLFRNVPYSEFDCTDMSRRFALAYTRGLWWRESWARRCRGTVSSETPSTRRAAWRATEFQLAFTAAKRLTGD